MSLNIIWHKFQQQWQRRVLTMVTIDASMKSLNKSKLVLTLQTKLSKTSQKLVHCRQQLKILVKKQEWVVKQRAHEELLHSLTNKLDKFSDKLATRRIKKLEKLQHPGAKPNPRYKDHIKRTHNEINKGNSPIKHERERNKDYHLVIGTIGETNGGLNDIIPTRIERNVYPELLWTKPLPLCTPHNKQPLYTLRYIILSRFLCGHTPLLCHKWHHR